MYWGPRLCDSFFVCLGYTRRAPDMSSPAGYILGID